MRLDKEQYQIVRKLCKEHNLSEKEVLAMIKAPFMFMREKIEKIQVDENWTEEQFNKKTYNFNIPSIGKLYASFRNLIKIKNAKKRRSRKGSSEI